MLCYFSFGFSSLYDSSSFFSWKNIKCGTKKNLKSACVFASENKKNRMKREREGSFSFWIHIHVIWQYPCNDFTLYFLSLLLRKKSPYIAFNQNKKKRNSHTNHLWLALFENVVLREKEFKETIIFVSLTLLALTIFFLS